MPKLHHVVHDLRAPLSPEYAAIAGLSGARTSRILRLERNITGRPALSQPMADEVIVEIMAALGLVESGFEARNIQHFAFKWFAAHRGFRLSRHPAIVRLPGHLVAMDGRCFVDAEHLEPTPLAHASPRWKLLSARYFD
ncbi:MAG: hypothetical protein ABWZ88_15280 [Variovorax sp.]